MDKQKQQNGKDIFDNQTKQGVTEKAHGGVMQEGCSEDGALTASNPMSLSAKDLSALAKNRKNGRPQNYNSINFRTAGVWQDKQPPGRLVGASGQPATAVDVAVWQDSLCC